MEKFCKVRIRKEKHINFLDFLKPLKIIKAQMPKICFPELIEMTIHRGNGISYKGDDLFFLVPFQEFLRYRQKGDVRVSVPQM